MTLNESDVSEPITWPYFKLLNEHFSVHYLDNVPHFKDEWLFQVSKLHYTPVLHALRG